MKIVKLRSSIDRELHEEIARCRELLGKPSNDAAVDREWLNGRINGLKKALRIIGETP